MGEEFVTLGDLPDEDDKVEGPTLGDLHGLLSRLIVSGDVSLDTPLESFWDSSRLRHVLGFRKAKKAPEYLTPLEILDELLAGRPGDADERSLAVIREVRRRLDLLAAAPPTESPAPRDDRSTLVHNHGYDPSCPERVTDGEHLRGACLDDDGADTGPWVVRLDDSARWLGLSEGDDPRIAYLPQFATRFSLRSTAAAAAERVVMSGSARTAKIEPLLAG